MSDSHPCHQELSAIWSMGFDPDMVRRALILADGNEERAVNLMADMKDRSEPQACLLLNLVFICSTMPTTVEEESLLRCSTSQHERRRRTLTPELLQSMPKEEALRVRVLREIEALRSLDMFSLDMFSPALTAALRKMNCRVEAEQQISSSSWKVTVSIRALCGTLKFEVCYSDSWRDAPQFHFLEAGNLPTPELVSRGDAFQRFLEQIWDPCAADFFAATCFPHLAINTFGSIEGKLECMKPSFSPDTALIISIGCAGGALSACQFFPPERHRLLGTQQPVTVRVSLPDLKSSYMCVTCCAGASRGSRYF